ncbi:MAG: MOP flippase family protein [Firmicutes bacterium]|nr:MOP flippase family protein [Bacillota bacterium]
MDLRKLAASGIKWTGSAAVIVLLLQTGSVIILGRLLKPEDFGIMGMITVVIGFAQAFSDMGISNAIIYRQDNSDDELSSLYWLNLAMGIFLFAAMISLAPLVELYFREPRLHTPFCASAFIFLLLTPGQQFQAVLQKKLQFGVLSKISVVSSCIGYGASIALAYMGYGVMSLVFGQIILQAVNSIMLLWIEGRKWFPRLHFKLSDLKAYSSFGGFQMGEKILNYFSSNVDYLIIGRLMGATPLGYYTFAYRLVTLPQYKINPVITRVAFPMFAKVQNDDETMRKGYHRVMELLALVVSPFLIGVIFAGEPFVKAVFGSKWLPSLILIQVMALAGLLKTLSNPSGSVILAKGKAYLAFWWNLVWVFIKIIVIWIACLSGLKAVAAGILIMQIIASTVMQEIINRMIGMKMSDVIKSLIPAFCSCAAMSLAILGVIKIPPMAGIHLKPLYTLVLLCLAGAAAYLSVLFLGFRNTAVYYINLILKR